MNAQASLFEPPVKDREQWMLDLRTELLRRHYGEEITTDAAWAIIEADSYHAFPSDVHHNALGSLFRDWDRARPVGTWHDGDFIHVTRASSREKANGNPLKLWRIT